MKTFFNVNTGIITAMVKETRKFPIISASLYQKRFKDLSIFHKHLLYQSNQFIRFRNISLRIKSFKNQMLILNSALLTKPLNKRLYFNLFLVNTQILFSSRFFILKRLKKNNIIFQSIYRN